MIMLDERQFRSDQPCDEAAARADLCAGAEDPSQTMLGAEQKAWLLDEPRRDTAWRCVGNPVTMGQLEVGGVPAVVQEAIAASGLGRPADGATFSVDQRDGYQAERAELLATIERDAIPDIVVVTGDAHFHQVHDLRPDFDDPLSPVVASELVGASISSSGFPQGSNPAVAIGLRAANDTMRWYEGERRGYAVCDVAREVWRTEFRTVADPQDPRSAVGTVAAFEVARGVAGAVQVAGPDIPPPA